MEPQEIVDALRREIQIDRIELQRTIADGFANMSNKFDEHAESNVKEFIATNSRLTAIETKASTIGKAVWSLIVTFVATALSYGFSYFIPSKH